MAVNGLPLVLKGLLDHLRRGIWRSLFALYVERVGAELGRALGQEGGGSGIEKSLRVVALVGGCLANTSPDSVLGLRSVRRVLQCIAFLFHLPANRILKARGKLQLGKVMHH